MNQIGKQKPWGITLFSTALCLMMLGGSIVFAGSPMNPAFPAFFSFLPVVFWMIAQGQKESDKTISDLKARIDVLETIARSRGDASAS